MWVGIYRFSMLLLRWFPSLGMPSESRAAWFDQHRCVWKWDIPSNGNLRISNFQIGTSKWHIPIHPVTHIATNGISPNGDDDPVTPEELDVDRPRGMGDPMAFFELGASRNEETLDGHGMFFHFHENSAQTASKHQKSCSVSELSYGLAARSLAADFNQLMIFMWG